MIQYMSYSLILTYRITAPLIDNKLLVDVGRGYSTERDRKFTTNIEFVEKSSLIFYLFGAKTPACHLIKALSRWFGNVPLGHRKYNIQKSTISKARHININYITKYSKPSNYQRKLSKQNSDGDMVGF